MTLYRSHLPCAISVRVQIQQYKPLPCCCFIAKYFLEAEIKIVLSNVLEFKHRTADTWISLSDCSDNKYFITWCQIVSLNDTIYGCICIYVSN